MPATVLIIEDNPEIREQFCHHIERDPRLTLVGYAASLAEAKSALKRLLPDIMLVDLGLPDGDGVEAITYARQIAPRCEAMVITIYGDEGHVLRALEAGASGYLLKDGLGDDICDQICLLLEGGAPINPVIARAILRRFHDDTEPNHWSPTVSSTLTDAECEVLSMLARGCSRREIADTRNTSFHTVASQIKNIYRKLEAHNRVEAISSARRSGLLKE